MASPAVTLHNGVEMPAIGFGTWELRGQAAAEAVAAALAVGYRHLDTASMYDNQPQVAQAVAASGVDRSELFITTKIWNDEHGFDRSAQALERSRRELDGENDPVPIDLVLIHWPGGSDRLDTWRQLETQLADGAVKAIGVSNYSVADLEELAEVSTVIPMVNQIEFNPLVYQRQRPTLDYCRAAGIQVTAWRPLFKGKGLDHPALAALAGRTSRTSAQVLLRWSIQHGVVPLPKSSTSERMAENLAVFDFELSDEEMESLNSLSEL